MNIRMVAVMVAALALLGACGEDTDTDSKNAYVERLNAVQRDYGRKIANSLSSVKADFASTRLALERAAQVSDEASSRLDAIEPPDEIAGEHDSLVASLDDFTRRLRKLREDVRGRDVNSVQASLTEFTNGSREVSRDIGNTIAEINRKL